MEIDNAAIWKKVQNWRENTPKEIFARFVERATDDKVKGSQLDVLLFEYFRLGISPETHAIIGAMRKDGNSQKLVITVTVEARTMLAERKPYYGSIEHGVIEFEADNITPRCATAYVYRKDCARPFVATVYYREYVAIRYDTQKPTHIWQAKGAQMTMKCAISAALKLAYPNAVSGVHLPEETSRPQVEQSEAHAAAFTGRRVDMETGEVISGASVSANPAPAEPAQRTARPASVAASVAPASASPATQTQPAPASTPETAPAEAEHTLGTIFEGLRADEYRTKLVKAVYACCDIPEPRAVPIPEHLKAMCKVADALNRPAPMHWVEFTSTELEKFLQYMARKSAGAKEVVKKNAEALKSPQEQPKTQERSIAKAPAEKPKFDKLSILQRDSFAHHIESDGVSSASIADLVEKISEGRTRDYTRLTKSEAEFGLDEIVHYLRSIGKRPPLAA